MKPLQIKKRPYLCIDGPFVGSILYLVSPTTLVFTYSNRRGRYIRSNKTHLEWEPQ